MIRRIGLLALIGAVVSLSAQDLPLGTVIEAENQRVVMGFDVAPGLLPASMVAIYGPGTVTKHPLTGEVTVEQRKLVAKAQILEASGTRLSGRVTWSQQGVVLEPGYDVIPMPDGASPNAPPVLTAEIQPIPVEVQSTITLRLPVIDPEGDPLSVVWSTDGSPGASGQLEARTTVQPELRWTAPAFPGKVTVRATISDRHGQNLKVDLPITVGELAADWRKRQLAPFAMLGGRSGNRWSALTRGGDGWWWAVDRDGSVHSIAPGWGQSRPLPTQEGLRIAGAAAVEARGDEVWILDQRERAVLVVARDGVLRNRMGNFSRPTDLAIDSAGTVYVADQASGGVVVHGVDGSYRLRLGQPGDGTDAFSGLNRIALGPQDELYCLDASAFRIQRFDRFHRRLAPWEIQGDRKNPPIDLAHHPRGLLVLLSDGQILIYSDSGVAGQAMKPLSEAAWIESLRQPTSIAVDGSGDVLVTYADNGVVARYDPQGRLSGVRGAELWALTRFVVDGEGRFYGLDERSGLISAFDSEGWMTTRFGGTERYGGTFQKPGAMAVSGDGKHLFVLDQGRVMVMRFDLAKPTDRPFVFGQRGENPGQFKEPVDLAVDGDGRCYVLDSDLHRVAIFDRQGSFLYNFGSYERGKASHEIITGSLLAVDEGGFTAYLYDSKRYEAMKFELDPQAKSARHISNAGGRGKELGQFYSPVRLACDRGGLLYVLDNRRYDLQVIDYSGTNAVTVHVAPLADLGMPRQDGMALGPDGVPWVLSGGQLLGLHWRR